MNALAQLRFYGQRSGRPLIAALGSATLALVTPSQSSADTREQLLGELLAQADNAMHEQHPLEAIDAWRAAYEVQPEYWIACNIGKAHLDHGSPREAAQYFEACLRLAPPSPPPEEKPLLEHYRDDLKALRKQLGALRVIINEKGAGVSIDSRSAGKSPTPETFVDPGSHRVSIRLAGYKHEEITVAVGKGESRLLAVTLKKEEVAPLRPVLPAPLPAAPPPADAAGRSPILLMGGVSAAVVALGFGVGFTAAADSAEDEAQIYRFTVRQQLNIECAPETNDPNCLSFQSADQEHQRLRKFAMGSFIGAGAAAAATVAYLLFPSSPVKPLVGKGASVVIATW